MLDIVIDFWEFFFYPLYQMENLPVIFDIVCAVLLCLAVYRFVRQVLSCF